ncbi:MAG TPA: hypothetical protein VFM58_02685 [Solirubrobacteraceae bacterium]|nr:hypothetical protein [Solirubrobacteraceae bacterium]
MPAAPSQPATDTLTRVIAGLIFVILLDATQLLFFYPDRTDTLWAWKLQPEVTAMLLGSVYAGGGYFFARILFGAPWQRVAAGFPAVIVFVWIAAIATLLHLDRFIKDGAPFVAWAVLYAVTPFLVPWLVVRNHRRYGAPSGPPLPPLLTAVLGAVGGGLLVIGVLFLIAPDVAIDGWPWPLTPLTARIVGAVLAMYGTLWLAVAVHRTWAGARIPLEAHAIGLAFLLLGIVRGEDAIDTGSALAIAIAAGAAAMLVASAVLSRRAT